MLVPCFRHWMLPLWIFLCLIFAGLLPVQAEPLVPGWKAGDGWRVRAVYPSPVADGVWSQPHDWTFRVSSETPSGLTLSVSNALGEQLLKLFYASGDLALGAAEVLKRIRGEPVYVTIRFQPPAPVVTQQSPVPFDSPVFPLEPDTDREFQVAKGIDRALYAVEKIRQTVRRPVTLPDELSGLSPADFLEVACTREDGSLLFRQFWHAGYPWPLYGENSNMKYWLVLP